MDYIKLFQEPDGGIQKTTNPGGYTDTQLKQNKILHKQVDPTAGLTWLDAIFQKAFKENLAKGEEDLFWQTYLGVNEKDLPKANELYYTEWDKKIEEEKKQKENYHLIFILQLQEWIQLFRQLLIHQV